MKITKETLEPLWLSKPVDQIASELNSTEWIVRNLAVRYGLPGRTEVRDLIARERQADDPSEDEITERAKAIRDSWPEDELARRAACVSRKRWTAPEVDSSQLFGGSDLFRR